VNPLKKTLVILDLESEMKPIQTLLATVVVISATLIASSAVQASLLYVTDYVPSEDQSANPYGVSVLNVQAIVPVTTADTWRHGPLLGIPPSTEYREFQRGAIAVDGRIDVAGPFNHTYNLDGSGQVSTICGLCQYVPYATDGTTDGQYNYTVAPETLGNSTVGIWRTDRDWRNESFLSPISAFLDQGERVSGITYDRAGQSFWLLATGGTTGAHFLELSLDGSTLKSEFFSIFVGNGALAMDYADNTLWWVPSGDRTSDYYSLTQFSRQGVILSSASINAGPSIYGAEFNLGSQTVPEPSVLALLGLGLLGLGIARVRKN
jgi:hypothetical protein